MSTATDTPTVTATGDGGPLKIRLWARHREQTLHLIHDEYDYLPNVGRTLVRKGVKLKFRDHHATISEEHLDLLARHPAFTGETEPKVIWFADDDEAVILAARAAGHTTKVVTGALGSGRGVEPPPTHGWDTATPEQIRELIWNNQVPDLVGALRYESLNRGNDLVMRYIGAALGGQPVGAGGEIPAPAAPPVAPDAFSDTGGGEFRPPAAPGGIETADPWDGPTPTGEIPPGSEAV